MQQSENENSLSLGFSFTFHEKQILYAVNREPLKTITLDNSQFRISARKQQSARQILGEENE
jgi:hypothetical protein